MEKNRNILVLTTLSCAFLGFIVPLVLWFVHKEYLNEIENKYLTNLLNFELTLLILKLIIGLILTIINIVPILGQIISGLGYLIIWLINIIIIIKATIKLTKEEEPQFPFILNLIK